MHIMHNRRCTQIPQKYQNDFQIWYLDLIHISSKFAHHDQEKDAEEEDSPIFHLKLLKCLKNSKVFVIMDFLIIVIFQQKRIEES